MDPQVSHVFQTAAMRFGHTLVTSGVHLRDRSSEGCNPRPYVLVPGPGHHGGIRTCNSFWRSPVSHSLTHSLTILDSALCVVVVVFYTHCHFSFVFYAFPFSLFLCVIFSYFCHIKILFHLSVTAFNVLNCRVRPAVYPGRMNLSDV